MKIFKISKNVKILILIMFVISITGIMISYFYYSNLSKYNDPRIVKTNKLNIKYHSLINEKKYIESVEILDLIENIYNSIDIYKNSYETGIVYNNRATSYLMNAIYGKTESDTEKKNLLKLAEKNIKTCISIYEQWLHTWGKLDRTQITEIYKPIFNSDTEIIKHKFYEEIFSQKINDIITAQTEIYRRLSVSYTNLGIIQRHQLKQEQSLESYKKAIELWDDNYTAENNLNVLLNKPIKKRTFLQQMFPPEK